VNSDVEEPKEKAVNDERSRPLIGAEVQFNRDMPWLLAEQHAEELESFG
jgi:hypothetical protein